MTTRRFAGKDRCEIWGTGAQYGEWVHIKPLHGAARVETGEGLVYVRVLVQTLLARTCEWNLSGRLQAPGYKDAGHFAYERTLALPALQRLSRAMLFAVQRALHRFLYSVDFLVILGKYH